VTAASWSTPVRVAEIPAPGAPRDPDSGAEVRAFNVVSTALAADGTAYVVWNEIRSARSSRVLISRSRDGGRRWSGPSTVAQLGTQAFIPNVAVMPNGTVGGELRRLQERQARRRKALDRRLVPPPARPRQDLARAPPGRPLRHADRVADLFGRYRRPLRRRLSGSRRAAERLRRRPCTGQARCSRRPVGGVLRPRRSQPAARASLSPRVPCERVDRQRDLLDKVDAKLPSTVDRHPAGQAVGARLAGDEPAPTGRPRGPPRSTGSRRA
jgi:hypothetical protein